MRLIVPSSSIHTCICVEKMVVVKIRFLQTKILEEKDRKVKITFPEKHVNMLPAL